MKSLFVFFYFTLAIASGQEVLMHRLRQMVELRKDYWAPGETLEFRVDGAALKTFGEWEPVDGKAPAVTRNQAVKLALESAGVTSGAEERVLVSLQKVNRWEVGRNVPPPGCSPWFYLIELHDLQKKAKTRYFLVTVGGLLARSDKAN